MSFEEKSIISSRGEGEKHTPLEGETSEVPQAESEEEESASPISPEDLAILRTAIEGAKRKAWREPVGAAEEEGHEQKLREAVKRYRELLDERNRMAAKSGKRLKNVKDISVPDVLSFKAAHALKKERGEEQSEHAPPLFAAFVPLATARELEESGMVPFGTVDKMLHWERQMVEAGIVSPSVETISGEVIQKMSLREQAIVKRLEEALVKPYLKEREALEAAALEHIEERKRGLQERIEAQYRQRAARFEQKMRELEEQFPEIRQKITRISRGGAACRTGRKSGRVRRGARNRKRDEAVLGKSAGAARAMPRKCCQASRRPSPSA